MITAFSMSLKARRDATREDRKQQADETTGAATAAKAISEAAASVVKLQDDQVEELRLEVRALQAEISAMNKRQDIEIQKRLRAEAQTGNLQDQVEQLREKLAGMGAQFELADQERVRVQRENGAMKTKIFEMSVGIQTLTRQIRGAGLEPEYVFDVPVMDERQTGPLSK